MDRIPPLDDTTRAGAARHLREALRVLGVDVNETELRETPERVAGLWGELFAGLDEEHLPPPEEFSPAPEGAGLVLASRIRFHSMCAHHLLPLFGRAHVAYLPGERLVGLGVLARAVDHFARRPTLQERIGEDAASWLERGLAPRGVAVLLEARHLCMEMRGLRKRARVATAAWRGVFRDEGPRAELLARLGGE